MSLPAPVYDDEREVVESMYPDARGPLEIADGIRLEVDFDEGCTFVTLVVALPCGYPNQAVPHISIGRSRGLTDKSLDKIVSASELHADVECEICLMECSVQDATIRPPCQQVFHSACIGRWAAIKFAEAEAEAGELEQSKVAQHDALIRDLDASKMREMELQNHIQIAEARVLDAEARAELARQGLLAPTVNEMGEEEDVSPETMKMQARLAKKAKEQLMHDLRKVQSHHADCTQKLGNLDSGLSKAKSLRDSVGLPCPVCRVPIPRDLLKQAAADIPFTSDGPAHVSDLSAEMQAQVRQIQVEQAKIKAELRCAEPSPVNESERQDTATAAVRLQRLVGRREDAAMAGGGSEPAPDSNAQAPVHRAASSRGNARTEAGAARTQIATSANSGAERSRCRGGWSEASWAEARWSESGSGWQGNEWQGKSNDSGGQQGRWRGR